MLGMFLAALDQTIVTAAIRTIGDDLHGLSVQAWVTTAYLITATISTPLYGKLSDIYGRKRFFLAAISIFVVGSAACAFAGSMYQLAAFRAVQGLGAGGLFSLALAIVGDLVPPREQARYQGFFLAVFGSASVLGPVIGGFLAGTDELLGIAGWRWVFLVNVPIGAVALVVVARVLRIRHNRRDHRIDWWGALTICVCLVPLLTVAEQGRTWGWGSGRSVACYLVGSIGLVAFLFVESRMGPAALIPLRFFRNRTFALTAGGGFVTGMGMFGGLALLPLYLQIVRGATPTESGLQLLPMTAGIMIGSLVSGQTISRTGKYRVFPASGAALMIVGLVLLHTVGVDTPFWHTGVHMGIFGLGLGFVLQPVTLAVQNAMPPTEIGVATASSTFFRQMGATAGTAIFLSILFATAGDKIAAAFRTDTAFQRAMQNPAAAADPALTGALHGDKSALDDTSFLERVTPVLAHPFKVGFSDAVDAIFLVAAAILLVAFVLFLFLPHVPLRTAAAGAPSSPEHALARADLSDLDADLARLFDSGPSFERTPNMETAQLTDDPTTSFDEPTGPGDAVVRGRIDGPGGLPLPGATLTITDFAGQQLARAVTAEDGSYRMVLHTGGSLLLICAADRHQPAAAVINVAAGEIRRVLSLAGAGQITGRVTDRAGRGLPGATLTLTNQKGEVVATTTAGPDGRYQLPGLDGPEYTLTATAPHARPASRTVSPNESGPVDLALAVGGVLTGNVRAAGSGHPIPQASVVAVDRFGRVAGAATTDHEGHYELRDLPPGIYTVAASGHAPVATRVELTGDHAAHDITLGTPAVLTSLH
ncbi:MFS transporter [Actinoplanes bogorensis]|uniref:MFS transporter n=2 Tax=Paractinoplanes bogorensis TaxID=1610840 RepID=A0ABS5YFF3_9ACTN|nr:MFS transporter [Actinoplanes bogorensis]